ncbi:flagellar hook-associated protein FlgK [Pseudomonas sp. LTJR-52]|uniref:flagellar hook-associated protein FlgK n=1 Tax=Pseudomonas sp. LTJR-52 TaxID=2479392 RepID=UPI000EFB5A46|nr:flagellar hook-associated protein FlgK [Pseudomonas sp. LTJR-52]AYN94982.1 flagellar hook-associated protein FlgK [Pseudomonas sp. LTJR-52]
MSNLLSIGVSGLSASQTALNTVGQNITNADTAGYSRQLTVQTNNAGMKTGTYFVGTGTTIADVRRVYSAYLTTQMQTSTALDADAQTYLAQTNQVNSLLADSTTGLSKVLQNFFASVQTASSSPTDAASRQLVLTQAANLTQRFNSVSSQLSAQNDYVNTQMESIAEQVNSLASTVAGYNQAITNASGGGSVPNDLLDKRDQAVTELSNLIGVTVVQQDNNYNLFLGTGQPLVTGNNVATLQAVPDPNNPSQDILKLASNNSSVDITSVVTGGQMGGLLRYRADILQPTMNDVGRMAIVLADSVNNQLEQGIDLDGDFGTGLFKDINDPSVVSQRSLASGLNTGTSNLNVTIEDSGALTTSDYRVTFSSETGYTVSRLSDGKQLGSGDLNDDPPKSFDGFSLSKQSIGTMANGDTFTVIPTRTGGSNIAVEMTNANDLALATPISGTTTTSNYGSATITAPVLTTDLSGSDSAALKTSLQANLPVKMVFSAASGGTQSYTVYDAAGNNLSTGSIIPGQANNLSLSVGSPSLSFTTTVNGSPGAGDSFTFSFNQNGAADNRNAQNIVNLQTAKTVGKNAGGGMSITGAYSSLTETVGAKTNQADLDAKATTAVLTQATNSRDSLSGVNLDEEAANLVKFQQYYSASAQIIKAAQQTFDTLISSL